MNAYKHILVAVDFSEEGELVFKRARQLAEANSAKLTLVHVVEYAELAYSGDLITPDEIPIDHELGTQAERRLEEAARSHGMTDATRLVEFGAAKREIVRVASEHDVDLIIVGSHGRHGLQLLLGSTANGVLHLAHCDVLAVRFRS